MTPKERQKVHFASYLETKVSASEENILCSFTASFVLRTFFTEIWSRKERCPIIKQINGVGKFLFFASFKSYNYFSEEDSCFISSQSLTARQRQSRQVIKISLTPFFRKRYQEDIVMLMACSRSNLIGEPLYFGK